MNEKTEKMLEVEDKFQMPIEVVLRQLYWSEKKTTFAIAKAIDVCQYTVWSWMNKLGIAKRSNSEAH
ncbi:unnamed protein product, partial [marine sediment metagenome]